MSKLADDSSGFARKIRDLVENIINKINGLSASIKMETELVERNVASATGSLGKSEDINIAVGRNMRAAESIVDLAQNQKSRIVEITHAVETINEATQQNAAVVEEITASTEEQLSIIETMYDSAVSLSVAIKDSNEVIGNFTKGFELTDDIRKKIEATKKLLSEVSKVKGLLQMESKEANKFLKEKQQSLVSLEFIGFADTNGIFKASSSSVDMLDCSAREYFQKAITGETYTGKEYVSILTGNYNIAVSTPVFEGNEIKGILMADINLNEN